MDSYETFCLCDSQSHRQGCDMGFVFAFHQEFGYEFHLAFQIPDFRPMILGMTSIPNSRFKESRPRAGIHGGTHAQKKMQNKMIPKCKTNAKTNANKNPA